MSDKPEQKHSHPDEPNQENENIEFDEKSNPPQQSPAQPKSGNATGALKRPIDWDSLPDNPAKRLSLQSEDSNPTVDDEQESSDSLESDGDESEFFSFNKKDKPEPKKNPDTAVLPEGSSSWKKIIDGQSQGTTATLGEEREVLFVIRGMIERVVMKDSGIVTLGRFDTGTVPNEEIDLLPYGALDRGVSRRHCKIQLLEDQLYVTDMGSTNGTFLAGVRLKPNQATILRKGDELLLGRLAVQILFR